jgi:transposase
MKTASTEIRHFAIKACRAGIPRQQIADILGYHLNSVSRWIREFEREERLEARPRGHRASIFSDEERQELIELIGKQVDMTLAEIRLHFSKDCSLNAIHKLVKSLGFVFKKNAEGKRARSRRYHSGKN